MVDYEAAWVALSAEIARQPQHGRQGLLTRMAELAEEHRLPAGELARVFRLYGVEVAKAELDGNQGEAADLATGTPSAADDDLPDQHDRGGHDGSTTGRIAAGQVAPG